MTMINSFDIKSENSEFILIAQMLIRYFHLEFLAKLVASSNRLVFTSLRYKKTKVLWRLYGALKAARNKI